MPTIPPPGQGIQHNANPSSDPSEEYQQALPYRRDLYASEQCVRAQDADGQFGLWGEGDAPRVPIELDEALRPAAELVAAMEEQIPLFATDGVVPGARWRRHSAGGKPQAWDYLDSWLTARRDYSRAWSSRDADNLGHVLAQCWDASDVRESQRKGGVSWMVDAFVCPLSGELLPVPRKLQLRHIVEACALACQEGTGGIVMSTHQWAAELGVSVRSVFSYMKALEEKGLVRRIRLRAERTDGRPTAPPYLDRYLYRIGPALEVHAAVGRFARRKRVALPGGIKRDLFKRLEAQFDRRAARRQFDVVGATYRGQYGLARCAREHDRRTREGRDASGASTFSSGGAAPPRSLPFKRQLLPDTPPLPGLAKRGPTGRSGSAAGERARSARVPSFAGPPVVPTATASAPQAPPQTKEPAAGGRPEGEAPAAPEDLWGALRRGDDGAATWLAERFAAPSSGARPSGPKDGGFFARLNRERAREKPPKPPPK